MVRLATANFWAFLFYLFAILVHAVFRCVLKINSVNIIKCPMLKTYERDFAQNPRSCDFPPIGGWLRVTDEVKSRSVVKARVGPDSDF